MRELRDGELRDHGTAPTARRRPGLLAGLVILLFMTVVPTAAPGRLGQLGPPWQLSQLMMAGEAVAVAAEGQPAEKVGGPGEAEHETREAAPSINPKTLALQLLNFAVLVFILVKFGGGAINKALAARHQQLKADLASAADLRALAEAKLAKQETRLASLENEIAEMRLGIKEEADAEKARLIAAAEERAARIKTETAFVVEQQIREAEVRLRRESAELALQMSEEILRRALGAVDQQRLLDTFVAGVEQGSAGVPYGSASAPPSAPPPAAAGVTRPVQGSVS